MLVGVSRALRSVLRLQVRGTGQDRAWALIACRYESLRALSIESITLAAHHTHPENIIRAQTQKSQGTPGEPGLKPRVLPGRLSSGRTSPCTKPSRDVREEHRCPS